MSLIWIVPDAEYWPITIEYPDRHPCPAMPWMSCEHSKFETTTSEDGMGLRISCNKFAICDKWKEIRGESI